MRVILGCIVVMALIQLACSSTVASLPATAAATAGPTVVPTLFSTPIQASTSVAQAPTVTRLPTSTLSPASAAIATARPSATATAVVIPTATRLPTQTPTRAAPAGPPFVEVTQLDRWALLMGPVDYSETPATQSLVFRVKACEPCKDKVSDPQRISDADDGKGIKNVEFVIVKIISNNPYQEKEVYRRTEENKFYCSFGGGEPDCSVLVFADNPKGWPGKNEPFDGDYELRVKVRTTKGEELPGGVFFSIKVEK
jgi:hypothetical protein